MEIKSGLSRSPRNTGMAGATGSTSSHVGPGSYNHTGGVSSTGGAAKSYAGFMTSAVRPSTTGGSGGSEDYPGPGAYHLPANPPAGGVGRPSTAGLSGGQSNCFSTKVARFAPSAPGSTVFRPSSVVDNPGPGRYTVQGGFRQPVGGGRGSGGSKPRPPPTDAEIRQARSLASEVDSYRTPAIPNGPQSYGYEEDGAGRLRRHPPPKGGYTGQNLRTSSRGGGTMICDTVGPAVYDPNDMLSKGVGRQRAANFHNSQTKRSGLPVDADTPGPGHYEETRPATGTLRPGDMLDRLGSAPASGDTGGAGGGAGGGLTVRQSAIFASKVTAWGCGGVGVRVWGCGCEGGLGARVRGGGTNSVFVGAWVEAIGYGRHRVNQRVWSVDGRVW